ncbi:MAG: F0F1 ATP synthase subunit delta [Patescibacteria group bacterium]
MNTSKKYLDVLAKALYKRSLTAGIVDEKKVRIITGKLINQNPFKLTHILKTYKRLISEKLKKEEIIIETNNKITLQKSVVDNLKKIGHITKVTNKTNPNITYGARIYQGDWIWDNTLEVKLEQIILN